MIRGHYVGPKCHYKCPSKERQREISLYLTHTGEGVKNTAERDLKPLKIKAMEPQAKECWQPPET